MSIGVSIPYIRKGIDLIVNHEKYAIAKLAFPLVDNLMLKSLKGQAAFAYDSIKTIVNEVSNEKMSDEKIEEISKFILKKFDFYKM